MKKEIIQEFKGVIEGVEINDKNVYYTTGFLLEYLEKKFKNLTITSNFIQELSSTIGNMYFKIENFSFSDLEQEFINCIDNSLCIDDLKFEYYGEDYYLEDLNQLIKNQKDIYVKEDVLDIEM